MICWTRRRVELRTHAALEIQRRLSGRLPTIPSVTSVNRIARIEPEMEILTPLLRQFSKIKTAGALAALIASGEVAETELALDARERAATLIE